MRIQVKSFFKKTLGSIPYTSLVNGGHRVESSIVTLFSLKNGGFLFGVCKPPKTHAKISGEEPESVLFDTIARHFILVSTPLKI